MMQEDWRMELEPGIDRRTFLRRAAVAGLAAVGGPPILQGVLGLPAWASRTSRTVQKTPRETTTEKTPRETTTEKTPRPVTVEKVPRPVTVEKVPRPVTVEKTWRGRRPTKPAS
jgi:hypothetical protein